MDDKKRTPVHVVTFGKVKASIWENQTKHGPRSNVTVCRVYMENGEWKRSDSFGRDELLTVSMALQEAYRWIWANRKGKEEDSTEEGESK